MIDTDKYEGHTEGPWHIYKEFNNGKHVFIRNKDATILWLECATHTDALLVEDAPLLLAEVKWLREKISELCGYFHYTILEADGFMDLMYELGMNEGEREE